MRISFVLPPPNLSGGFRVLATQARLLAERGHEVVARSVRPAQPPLGRKVRHWMRGDGWPGQDVSTASHFDGIGLDYQILDKPGPIEDRDLPDADVVLATWWETAYWVAALSDRKGAKAYYMQDYGAPGQTLAEVAPTWRLPLHIITISQWLKQLIQRHSNVAVDVVPNGVDPRLFYAEPRQRQGRPTLGTQASPFPEKNLPLALDAAARLQQWHSDLLLTGFGFRELDAADGRSLEPQFHYRPSNAQIAAIYRQCDGWLLASRREGFGLPILEAMACRTPVIATPAGAAPEILKKGGGWLVPHDDVDAMAEAAEQLLTMDEAAWQALAEQAQQIAWQYTWDKAAGTCVATCDGASRAG
jgi:glycosyltransferase involved in cell wall biosynthesis